MFSPHQEDPKAPELELDHHTHHALVASVPQPLLHHHQQLSLQHVPPPDPFDTDHTHPPSTDQLQVSQQVQQVLPTPVQQLLQHQHPNPTDLQQHPSPHPQDIHLEPTPVDAVLSPPMKKQRRRYDNNFKAEVLEHLKIHGAKLPQVAKNFGIPENTLREWTKVAVVRTIESARAKHGGTLKANMFDPMHRLTESLMIFFDRNEQQPQHLKQPVTTKLVVAKGIEARNNLLELNEIQPFLEAKEKKALETFTGSDSWAKKFAKRHDLKMTGARVKELGDEDVRTFRYVSDQLAFI